MPKTESTALVPIRPARTIEDLARAYTDAQDRGHVLSPIAVVDDIPPFHKVALHATLIDPTIQEGKSTGPEVYQDQRYCDKSKGEVALGAVALAKIMRTAGAKIKGSPRRVDDANDPYYREVEITLQIRELDGSWTEVTKTSTVDLRDGAPETMKPEWAKDQHGKMSKTGKLMPLDETALSDKRRMIGPTCETKALNRCIRHLLHIKRVYTQAELAKPFWIPVLVPDLDPMKPDERALLLGQVSGAAGALYGGNMGARAGLEMSKPSVPRETPAIDVKPLPPPELELPPEEPPKPKSGLPVPEELLKEVPTHDEQRYRYLIALIAWCEYLRKALGDKRAEEFFAEVGEDFKPLTATYDELKAFVMAFKARLGANAS